MFSAASIFVSESMYTSCVVITLYSTSSTLIPLRSMVSFVVAVGIVIKAALLFDLPVLNTGVFH